MRRRTPTHHVTCTATCAPRITTPGDADGATGRQGSGAEHRRVLCERHLGVSILVELRHHRLHLLVGELPVWGARGARMRE